MDRRHVAFLAIALLVIVGGAMVLIGVLRGDDTAVDPNGVNGAPFMSGSARP